MTEAATGAAAGGAMGGLSGTVIYLVLMIVFFYFVLIRPQKKREKQTRMMLNDMRPGDEIITIGGIMGNIVSIKEDRVVIETGANRTKLTFEKSAIKSVLTVHEDEDEYEIEEEE
ncbi:MAG: preprotein translocase subunit YajC [Clostridia bacterium]|nr:preprotein translocase subunit YajC [Clostridia bacterium]